MARWVWPAVAGVVTSATGVVINVATDLKTEPWSWVLVVLLTGLGVVVAMRMRPEVVPVPPVEPSVEPEPVVTPPEPRPTHGGVSNSVSGTIHGDVMQIGSVGRYNDNSISQRAVARDNGTVHQAGRDIRSDDDD